MSRDLPNPVSYTHLNSDVFVMPSVSEPFGIAPLEAMPVSYTNLAMEIEYICIKRFNLKIEKTYKIGRI